MTEETQSSEYSNDIDRNCQTCGAGPSFTIPVWQNLDGWKRDEKPDYIGCTECHTMRPVKEPEDRFIKPDTKQTTQE